MKAILVCVEYSDFLNITLPINKHHFESVTVVTSLDDIETFSVASRYDCKVFKTNSFYTNGAKFNKWLALEEGLDWIGRDGWICVMDADIVWPKTISLPLTDSNIGTLYGPYRRMLSRVIAPLPEECDWKSLPRHRNTREFAGYTQIFHADDPHLGSTPWYETNWSHAGGADSFFQEKWPLENKVRPSWEVLHLGHHGKNWCGRVTDRLDGEPIPLKSVRESNLKSLIEGRRSHKGYEHEKLSDV